MLELFSFVLLRQCWVLTSSVTSPPWKPLKVWMINFKDSYPKPAEIDRCFDYETFRQLKAMKMFCDPNNILNATIGRHRCYNITCIIWKIPYNKNTDVQSF